jgi:hypothetical protein
MRSRLIGHVTLTLLLAGLSGAALADSKAKGKAVGDKEIEKQSAWEQKVMGEDSAKAADLKKIAAAQKLADKARKNPPPPPTPKVKDPNKEGVRAKHEAAIGLPIASDEPTRKKHAAAKKDADNNSANDELGSLVASSLAADKASHGGVSPSAHGNDSSSGRTRGKGHARASGGAQSGSSSSALDQLFGSGK